uniref:AraC family transcriptional regulator n=1 Tax=Pseudoclavibacter sp. RFBI5 TaxID=2080578 RepID=UPI001C66B881|nr:helix-turn-helix domain-containing protein [Pseudoclavibacter sp. RFBI5]
MDSAHVVGLENDEALQWLQEQGWEVRVVGTKVRVHADIIGTPAFTLGRIWQTATGVDPGSGSYNPDLVYVNFVLTGHLMVQSAGGPMRKVAAPHFYTHSARRPASVSSTEPHSCLFIAIPRERLAELPWVESQAPGPFVTENAFRRVFIAAANASLDSKIQEQQHGFSYWRRGVEELLLAALTETRVHEDVKVSSPRDQHLARAHLLIEENYRDAGFSTQELARALNISISQLHRIFAAEGKTAGATLRARRVHRARTLLGMSANSKSELLGIAQESGFRSVRTMRRLLREEDAERSSGDA